MNDLFNLISVVMVGLFMSMVAMMLGIMWGNLNKWLYRVVLSKLIPDAFDD